MTGAGNPKKGVSLYLKARFKLDVFNFPCFHVFIPHPTQEESWDLALLGDIARFVVQMAPRCNGAAVRSGAAADFLRSECRKESGRHEGDFVPGPLVSPRGQIGAICPTR